MKLIKLYSEEVSVSFHGMPVREKEDYFFSVKGSVSCEEDGSFSFTDVIKKLTDKIKGLDVGGSFIDNIGRGYVDSVGEKQYTKKY